MNASQQSRPPRVVWRCAVAGALLVYGGTCAAQEYSRFLSCEGQIVSQDEAREAFLNLALRFTNRTATIQRSNVLPIGEVMQYVPTPAAYSMTYAIRREGTQVVVVPGWFRNTILVAYPNLKKLNQIRIGIDRQSGALNGALLNERDESLGTLNMMCTASSEKDLPQPKL